MTQQDKLVDKLSKMMAMRDGEAAIGNDEAADAFAKAINRMLIEHDLSMEEVRRRAGSMNAEQEEPIIEEWVDFSKFPGIDAKKARVGWQEALAMKVAQAHACRILVRKGSSATCFVGTTSHAKVAEYAFGTLAAAAERMSWKAYNKYFYGLKNAGDDVKKCRGYRASWLTAFVVRIGQRFDDAMNDSSNPGMAMVLVGNALVRADEFMKRRGVCKVAGAKQDRGWNAQGRADGKTAADNIALNRKGVEGRTQEPVRGNLGR